MIGHLRSSSDRIGKFSFDLIYSLTVKKSIYLLDIFIKFYRFFKIILNRNSEQTRNTPVCIDKMPSFT